MELSQRQSAQCGSQSDQLAVKVTVSFWKILVLYLSGYMLVYYLPC